MSEFNFSTNNVMLDEEKLYPVDKIVGRRVRKGKVEYRVRWKNYPPDTDSWEPSKSLYKTCLPLIKEFNKDKSLNSNTSVPTSNDSSNDTLVTSSKNHDKIFHNESNSLEKTLKSSLNHSKFKNSDLNKNRSKENIKSQNIPDKAFSENYEKRQLEIIKITNSGENINSLKYVKDNQSSDKPIELTKDQKKVIYLEDNEIDEPCVSKSKNSSINGVISNAFKKSFISNTEKASSIINKNSDDIAFKVTIENVNNNLKRKSTPVVIANQKKTKLNDKESKINPISFIEKDQIQKFNILSRFNNNNNNNNIINNVNNNNNNNNHNCCNSNYGQLLPNNKAAFDFDNLIKCKNLSKTDRILARSIDNFHFHISESSTFTKPQLISEEKIEKSFGKLPFQRYKESDHFDNNDISETRRSSIRQIEATNRFREIIVRKNVTAGFTEICLHNNSHSFPNCFNIKILNELIIAFKQAVNDSSRVILLSAIGSVFSSGIDLETIISSPQKCVSNVKNNITSTAQLTTPLYPNQQIHDLAESLKKFLLELLHFPKPIVVGVNGPAIGLGCAILPLCDLIYATESSSFHLPYTTLSQTPEAGSSLTLPMLVGMPTANQLLLCGRKWSAKEAFNKGLISEIIFSDKFKPELFSRCEKLAHVPSMSTETMKCMLRLHYKEQIDFTINMECKKLIEIWKSNEFRNSAQSFIDHELPNLLL